MKAAGLNISASTRETRVSLLILIGRKDAKLKEGRLADLTPTLLDMMGLEKPDEMTGESLLEK